MTESAKDVSSVSSVFQDGGGVRSKKVESGDAEITTVARRSIDQSSLARASASISMETVAAKKLSLGSRFLNFFKGRDTAVSQASLSGHVTLIDKTNPKTLIEQSIATASVQHFLPPLREEALAHPLGVPKPGSVIKNIYQGVDGRIFGETTTTRENTIKYSVQLAKNQKKVLEAELDKIVEAELNSMSKSIIAVPDELESEEGETSIEQLRREVSEAREVLASDVGKSIKKDSSQLAKEFEERLVVKERRLALKENELRKSQDVLILKARIQNLENVIAQGEKLLNLPSISRIIKLDKKQEKEIRKKQNLLSEKQKKLDLLSKVIATPTVRTQTAILKQEIAVLNEQILTATTSEINTSWVSTNDFRDVAKNIINNPLHDKKVGAKLFQEVVNGLKVAPVNMRREVINTRVVGFDDKGNALLGKEGQRRTLLRFGAIKYDGNGFTNLQEMEQMRNNPELRQNKVFELKNERDKLQKDLENTQKKMEKSDAAREKELPSFNKLRLKVAAYDYAINELQADHLETSIQVRTQALESQMISVVSASIEDNPTAIRTNYKGEQEFHFIDQRLLNPNKFSFDSPGIPHDEGNQLRDHLAIFQKFDGKLVKYDPVGPFMDEKGVLHLPLEALKGRGVITLRPHCLNISVQTPGVSGPSNTGFQREINEEALKKLRIVFDRVATEKKMPEILDKFNAICVRLQNGESSYTLAEDFSALCLLAGIPHMEGCFGCKDRGAIVAYRAGILVAKEERLKENDSTAKKTFTKLEGELYDKDRTPIRSAADNNPGVTALKSSQAHLPGKKWSFFWRIAYFWQQYKASKVGS